MFCVQCLFYKYLRSSGGVCFTFFYHSQISNDKKLLTCSTLNIACQMYVCSLSVIVLLQEGISKMCCLGLPSCIYFFTEEKKECQRPALNLVVSFKSINLISFLIPSFSSHGHNLLPLFLRKTPTKSRLDGIESEERNLNHSFSI